MHITAYSLAMACIWTSVLTIIMCAIQKGKRTLQYFGVNNLLILYAFCIIRMTVPIELPVTKVVSVEGVYNAITYLCTKVTIGGAIQAGYLFLMIWCCGTVIKLLLLIKDYRTTKRLLCSCIVQHEGMACELLKKLQNETGDRRRILVYIAPFDVPMEMGILHPAILLPDREYTEQKLYYIMKHEYMHILNHDAAIKLLLNLWSCIFWWNPTAYLLNVNIEDTLELKCDLKVANGLRSGEKAEYLSAILDVIQDAGNIKALKLYDQDKVTKRFRCIAECLETTEKAKIKYRAYMAAMIAVYIIVFYVSYSFVFQSKFDVPMEEVITEDNVHFLEPETVFLREKEGRYEVIYNNKCISIIDENTALLMKEEGFEIREENTR